MAANKFRNIAKRQAASVNIRIEEQPPHIAFDFSEDETSTAARVKLIADLSDSPNEARNQMKLLLGRAQTHHYSSFSILGQLINRLNRQYHSAGKPLVKLQLLHKQEPGSLAFHVDLFPIPGGMDKALFTASVRRTLSKIQNERVYQRQ